MATPETKKMRSFKTARTFPNVIVVFPKRFNRSNFFPTAKIKLDGVIVEDPSHYFYSVKVDEEWVDIHFYAADYPDFVLFRRRPVCDVAVVTEGGTTRINAVEKMNADAEFFLGFSTNGERGTHIRQCKKGKIVFKRIGKKKPEVFKPPVPSVLSVPSASKPTPPAPVVSRSVPVLPPAPKPVPPEFFTLEQTTDCVLQMVAAHKTGGGTIPPDSDRNPHTRACWVLGQLQSKHCRVDFSTEFGSSAAAVTVFERSLRKYVNEGAFRAMQ